MESRQSIIDDLWRLGLKMNQILVMNPPTDELRALRDGLISMRNQSSGYAAYRDARSQISLAMDY